MSGQVRLVALQRLISLCKIHRDLARQARLLAASALEEAETARTRGAEAVEIAERDWREALSSRTLAPEFASMAGDTLIARATTLDIASQRELRAQTDLRDAEDAGVEAEARLRQMDMLHAALRRKERHRMDQRALARAEDRVMLGWGQR